MLDGTQKVYSKTIEIYVCQRVNSISYIIRQSVGEEKDSAIKGPHTPQDVLVVAQQGPFQLPALTRRAEVHMILVQMPVWGIVQLEKVAS